MFKYAVIFLIISLIAGAFGLTNVSAGGEARFDGPVRDVLPRVPRARGFAYLASAAIDRPALAPAASAFA
ncbi:MAG: hypothetical protein QOI46_2479 [Alphaproteobacteria bacterium]|jgi:Protein of unknown function (DUF1328)|nr:hypothetical protein [Alphaproteobacteria bacterium]